MWRFSVLFAIFFLIFLFLLHGEKILGSAFLFLGNTTQNATYYSRVQDPILTRWAEYNAIYLSDWEKISALESLVSSGATSLDARIDESLADEMMLRFLAEYFPWEEISATQEITLKKVEWLYRQAIDITYTPELDEKYSLVLSLLSEQNADGETSNESTASWAWSPKSGTAYSNGESITASWMTRPLTEDERIQVQYSLEDIYRVDARKDEFTDYYGNNSTTANQDQIDALYQNLSGIGNEEKDW